MENLRLKPSFTTYLFTLKGTSGIIEDNIINFVINV